MCHVSQTRVLVHQPSMILFLTSICDVSPHSADHPLSTLPIQHYSDVCLLLQAAWGSVPSDDLRQNESSVMINGQRQLNLELYPPSIAQQMSTIQRVRMPRLTVGKSVAGAESYPMPYWLSQPASQAPLPNVQLTGRYHYCF